MNEKCPRKILVLLCLFLTQQLGQCHTTSETAKVRTGRLVSRLYRRQLTDMLNILDGDMDPCEDFFTHACGDYAKAMRGELRSSEEANVDSNTASNTVSPFLYNYEDRMNFFESRRTNFTTSSGQLLGALYASCKKRNRSPLTQWHRMLREISLLAENVRLYLEWPLLRHEWEDLEAQHFYLDWMPLAADLAAHGVLNFLHIFFAEGTIFIAPVSTQDIRCESLYEWQVQLLPFRRKRSKQALQVIASDLHTFCRELIGKLPLDPELHAENYTRNESQEDAFHLFSYNVLGKYLQMLFERLQFSHREVTEARVILIEEARLRDIVALIRSTHPSVLFNFVLWQVYATLRYEDCFLLTEEFEELLLSEYWNWDVFNEHFTRKVALATYLYHTTRFQERRRAVLLGEQWDRFLYVKLQRSDFNLPRLLASYAKTSLDPANLTVIYEADKLVEGDFYGNLLALRRLQLRNTFYTAFIDPEDYNHPIYFLRHFLHFTILTMQRPLFHYFATLGFDLWHKPDLLYSSDGYYTALDCLEHQSLLNFDDTTMLQVLDESQVSETFRFYRAFIESLKDYEFWLEGESFAFAEQYALEYFGLTSKRILFYAVAQLHCGRNDVWYGLLINRSFMNMPQFEAAFECDAEVHMNPQVKCMINHCE
ncbi:uncharacterized protein LOC128871767 [Anastrepha ludens]|uniref:uncharacterized protein LOC128871767 n=1 Tax=Anastrepha ludens TaxID=28586 RepID=UPI0023AECD76|nr:uncharacterized protein LOC128871767 [Anastrepha ludens]